MKAKKKEISKSSSGAEVIKKYEIINESMKRKKENIKKMKERKKS